MKPKAKNPVLLALLKPVTDALATGRERELRRLAADLINPGGDKRVAGELLALVLDYLTSD